MSSRDIDTTSENVLHDWAREEGADDENAEHAEGTEDAEQEELVVESGGPTEAEVRPGGRR